MAIRFLDGPNKLTLREGSSIVGNIEVARGSLVLDQATNAVLANNLIGGGSVTKAGGGTLILAGANTYSGGTTVTGGLIGFSALGNLGSGPITLNGGGLQWASGNTADISAKLKALGASGATFDTNGNNVTFTTPLTGPGGLTKAGASTLTLAGNDTYTGPTTIVGGTLAVRGRLASSVRLYGGMITGSATLDHLVSAGGITSPGEALGTLSVAGDYIQMASGGLLAEVSGGAADRLEVGGTAILQGGAVQVATLAGAIAAPSTTYTIVSAVGGLSGTFSSVNDPYPFLQSSLSYDANNAYLTLQIGGFAAAAATPIQAAVGTVIDANVNTATGDFASVLSSMATGVQSNSSAQYVLQQLSGNNYAGFSNGMVQGAQLFMNNFAGQGGGGAAPGGGGSRVALAEACDVACDSAMPVWGAWGGALGGLGTIGAGQAVGGVTYNAGGFAAGLDRALTENLRLGVTAGYTTGTQWVSGFDGLGRSDTFNVGLYGGFAQDRVYADALFGYAYSTNQMWRQILVPGLSPRTALGQTGANQWYGQLEGGYRFDLGTSANAYVTPFARLQGYSGTQNGFTETGAQSLNLTVAQQTTNSLRSVLGATLGGSVDLGWREKLALQLRLGWSHEYADVNRPVTATLAGAPAMPFTTWGVSPTRDGAVLGLGANTAIAEATQVYLRYEGNIAGQDSAHAITGGVRMTW